MITIKHQIELRHLRYFLMVSDELNFRKAAEKLFIAQPGLSRQIKHMEEALDVELFIRDKRNVALTEAGKYLQQEARFLINHVETISKHAKAINQGHQGELRIGYVGSAMQTVAPAILKTLNDQYPDISVSLEELNNQTQIKRLSEDQLDLGFVRLTAVPEGFEIVKMLTEGFSVVLPKNHSLSKDGFKSIGQLRNESFILFSTDYSPLYYEKILSICEDAGFHPKVTHKSVHAYTIYKLVEEGLGIAIVPSSLKAGYQLNVKYLEIPNIPQTTTLSSIWKKSNRNPVLGTVTTIIEKEKALPE